jgi:hypothetical protein
MHTLPPRRSRRVTMAVSSTMEPINALALSCSTSSLRMTTSLLTTASHRRNGSAELPRRYALSKPGHLPSSICHTMLSSTRTSPGRKRLWRGHGWQAQRIVGERQTPSGLEYEVSLEKTLWLPKATLDTKLVRRYRAEQRAVTRVRTRWSSRLQETGSSVRLQCR